MRTLFRTLCLTVATATVAGIAVAAPPKPAAKAGATTTDKPSMTMAKHTASLKSHKKREKP